MTASPPGSPERAREVEPRFTVEDATFESVETVVGGYVYIVQSGDQITLTKEGARQLASGLSDRLAFRNDSPPVASDGWQDIASAPMWDALIVTDGEHVAISCKAESDFGWTYWAIDPEDGLEWEPTHWMRPPPTPDADHARGEG